MSLSVAVQYKRPAEVYLCPCRCAVTVQCSRYQTLAFLVRNDRKVFQRFYATRQPTCRVIAPFRPVGALCRWRVEWRVCPQVRRAHFRFPIRGPCWRWGLELAGTRSLHVLLSSCTSVKGGKGGGAVSAGGGVSARGRACTGWFPAICCIVNNSACVFGVTSASPPAWTTVSCISGPSVVPGATSSAPGGGDGGPPSQLRRFSRRAGPPGLSGPRIFTRARCSGVMPQWSGTSKPAGMAPAPTLWSGGFPVRITAVLCIRSWWRLSSSAVACRNPVAVAGGERPCCAGTDARSARCASTSCSVGGRGRVHKAG